MALNKILDKVHLDNAKLEYLENLSESPEINYSRKYLSSIHELEKLIGKCRSELGNVTVPTLLIQGSGDPVVDPASADIIADNVGSEDVEKVILDRDRHIIVRNEGADEVFESYQDDIQRINLILRTEKMWQDALKKLE